MQPSDQQIQEIKALLEAQHGREFSWEEATNAARDMDQLARAPLRYSDARHKEKKNA
jgi:hypothetical protein